MTWYVVFRGQNPGVYSDWQTCLDQVSGFSRCSYRSYPSKEEAVADYLAYFGCGDSSSSQYVVQDVGDHPALHAPPPAAPQALAGPPAQEPRQSSSYLVMLVCVQFFVIITLLAYNFA